MATSINASVATNDGIANIFSAKSGDSSIQQATPWELGGSFAVAGLSPPTAGDAAADFRTWYASACSTLVVHVAVQTRTMRSAKGVVPSSRGERGSG